LNIKRYRINQERNLDLIELKISSFWEKYNWVKLRKGKNCYFLLKELRWR